MGNGANTVLLNYKENMVTTEYTEYTEKKKMEEDHE